MAGEPVAIGPFFGGLNDAMDPSNIEDNQCSILHNFDVDLDGSVVTRPPFVLRSVPAGPLSWHPITTYSFADVPYMIFAARSNAVTTREMLIAENLDTGDRTTIVNNDLSVRFIDALQYDDKLYVLSETDEVNAGVWTPSAGWTSIGPLPRGIAMTVYKERLFVFTARGRVYFSKVADFTQWESSSFFDINPGDGDEIRAVVHHMGQMVIFKRNSTFVFGYDSAPERATIQQVNATIGTDDLKTVVVHENLIYTLHRNKLYAINNWRWQDVSYKVKIYDPLTSPYAPQMYRWGESSLSVVGRRIFLRHRTKYWVYFPDLEAWATWGLSSTLPAGTGIDNFVRSIRYRSDGLIEYWTGTHALSLYNGSTSNHRFKFIDGYPPSSIESEASYPEWEDTFVATLASKMYDYTMPYNFKRLHWWGVDVVGKRSIDAKVYPQTYNRTVTWSELEALGQTWDWFEANNRTWSRPIDISIDVTDSMTLEQVTDIRSFIKYIKSLRFRKIVYELSHTHDAFRRQGPLRIFNGMAVVSAKQLGPRKAN